MVNIRFIPDKERCLKCDKNLSKCNSEAIINPDGSRLVWCEECFKEELKKRKDD